MNKKMNLLFSIIVPAYQIENYLLECIDSVENQDYVEYEIIIVDDGSYDGTRILAEQLKDKFSNIIVVHQMNQGLSEARNCGIRIAQGKYCILLDGDDLFQNNTLKELAKCIELNNFPDVVVSRFITFDSELNVKKECSFTFDIKKLNIINSVSLKFKEICHYWLAGWMFCVRSDYIRKYDLFFKKGLLHEDEEWMPRVALHARTMAFNNTPYYIYRTDRNGSITNKLNESRIFDSIRIINSLQQELEDDTYSDKAKEVMKYRIQILLFGTINKTSLYKDSEHYGKMINLLKENLFLLKSSERKIYRLSYFMCTFIGVEKTGIFFQCMENIRSNILSVKQRKN